MAIPVVWIMGLRLAVAPATMAMNAIAVSLARLAGLAAQFCFAAEAAVGGRFAEGCSRCIAAIRLVLARSLRR